ncbi:hypothetical protein [Pleomorphomonas oryzae]|uniref:hypothetical protein n=1 Tax=Pleomorphomonas oryzae TaxID=261934 RepID=UPI00047A532C|nr:hypothetical protein [Pleomorphomonas oryzae]
MVMMRCIQAAFWTAILLASPAMAESLKLQVESGSITDITGNQGGHFYVSITSQSSRDLYSFTERYVGKKVDILVAGTLMVSSIIREPIHGRELPIMLSMTDAEWRETIAKLIKGTATLELRTTAP